MNKQGANKGATMAFLISTPESGVDSIAVTYALLDPIMTIIRPLAAFLTAMTAGFLENCMFWRQPAAEVQVDRSCPLDGCCDGVDCPDEVHRQHHSLKEKLFYGIRYAFQDVWGDIVGWFFIGLLLAALITALLPDAFMASVLGGGIHSMLVMLVIGIPIYICATASTPVAAALILKGVSPGAALVFLLVGPATNVTSLSVLLGILGRGSTAIYLSVIAGCAVLLGLGVDMVYSALGISPQAVIGKAGELVPAGVKLVAAALLLMISVRPLYTLLRKRIRSKNAPTVFMSSFPDIGNGKKVKHQHLLPPGKNHCGCGR